MATFTENYNLIKPTEEDYYDIQDFNENMDTIDTLMDATEQALEETQQEVSDIGNRIGQATDAGEETVFGHLNRMEEALAQPSGVIKSVQYKTFSIPINTTSSTVSINTVDTNKTFVIMERLSNPQDSLESFSYTLSATKITISHSKYSNTFPGVTIGFWIVEFY